MSSELPQAAPIALSRNDHRASVPAFENTFASLQYEAALRHGLVVTGQTVLFENGQKVLLEVDRLGRDPPHQE